VERIAQDRRGIYARLQNLSPNFSITVTTEFRCVELLIVVSVFEGRKLNDCKEFENVRIRVEYKWGVKEFAPRTLSKRDNGLYGLVGDDKVWPRCLECQIEEGDVGDFFLLDGVRGVQSPHGSGLFGQGISPVHGWPAPGSDADKAAGRPSTEEPSASRKIKDGNFEKLDDWNTVEVLWQGDRATHIINGRAVKYHNEAPATGPRQSRQLHSANAWQDRYRDRIRRDLVPQDRGQGIRVIEGQLDAVLISIEVL